MYILSIIIPVYNSEKYLSKCIHSIIDGQNNNNNIEIILVDDGSTDQSSYLCDLFAKQYTNIHPGFPRYVTSHLTAFPQLSIFRSSQQRYNP